MTRIGFAVVAVALFAAGWFGSRLMPASQSERTVAAELPTCVEIEVAKEVDFNPIVEYVGHVEPAEVTDILPQIDGYIRKVCFQEGSRVTTGQLLFEIDDEQYVAAKNLRNSEVRSAEARVLVAQSEVERAERYYRRLTCTDDRGVTATERDNSEMALAAAKASLNAANAAVEQAKAAAAIADFNLKHTRIYSQITGRIGKSLRHVGDYVSPSKTALAKVVKVDPIRVAFPVTDRDYHRWRASAGMGDARRFRIRLANGDIYRESGKLAFGDNEMNRQTGTLVMFVDFANPDGGLVPNAFVRVLVDSVTPPRALVVPAGAVQLGDDGKFVWAVDDKDAVHPANVEIDTTMNGLTRIVGGIGQGTRVVSAGGFKLKPGTIVRTTAKAEAR